MSQPGLINPLFIATLAAFSIDNTVHMLPNDLADNTEIGIAPFRQFERSDGHIQDLLCDHECINAKQPTDDGTREMPSLDTLPLEVSEALEMTDSLDLSLYCNSTTAWSDLGTCLGVPEYIRAIIRRGVTSMEAISAAEVRQISRIRQGRLEVYLSISKLGREKAET